MEVYFGGAYQESLIMYVVRKICLLWQMGQIVILKTWEMLKY